MQPMRALTMLLLLLTLLPFTAAAVHAGDFQPLDDIRRAAISAVAVDADGSADVTLDANLQMPKCAAPLTARGGPRGVAEVACSEPTAWKLYVPVRVQRSQTVVVLVRSVGAGQAITEEAISVERRDSAAIVGGAVASAAQAVGRVAVRTLVAGNPLMATDLVEPRVVHRGEAVTLVARAGAIDARAPGKALGDAGLNERINVENASSHRIVQGIVRSSGEIEVAL